MNRKWQSIAFLALLFYPAVGWSQDDEKGKANRRSNQRPRAGQSNGDSAGSERGNNSNGADTMGGLGNGQGMGMMLQMFPLMAALDADQDGQLSASEIENASKALLKLDKNGDGVLSPEELRPDPSKLPNMMAGGLGGAAGGNQPSGAMMMRMFENRDTNKDGKLSGDEIPEPMRARLAMIDQDGDGAIQKSEIERAAAMMSGGQRPGRGNGNDGSGVKPKRPSE